MKKFLKSYKFFLLAVLLSFIVFSKNWKLRRNIGQSSDFYLNPKSFVCDSNRKHLFFAFVTIAPEQFENRKLIRRTWGNNSLYADDFKLVFSVGQSENSTINDLIEKEFQNFKDIVQLNNYIDSNDTKVIKVMESLKWAGIYCKSAQYILKINDDVVVNTFSLIKYFKNIKFQQNQLFGHLLNKTKPLRELHKNQVDDRIYSREFYSDYPESKKKPS